MPGVKRRPPREHVLSTSMCSGCACGRRGSPTAHPCAGCELARILRAILRTFPSSARRVRGAPFGAHDSPHPCGLRFGPLAVFASAVLPMQSACVTNEAVCLTLLRTRPGWPASKQSFFWGPCAAVRAGRSGPQGGRNGLRPLAAAPWMARRQARPARSDFSSMDGRKTQHRGGLSLGDFSLAKQREVTRARGRRAEQDMDVGPNSQQLRKLPPSALRAPFHPRAGEGNAMGPGLRRDDELNVCSEETRVSALRHGVHLRCAWIDITTPNPVSRVIADVPP